MAIDWVISLKGRVSEDIYQYVLTTVIDFWYTEDPDCIKTHEFNYKTMMLWQHLEHGRSL